MRNIFTSTVLFFLFFAIQAQQKPLLRQWDKRFGGLSSEIVNSAHPTADGGYIMGGYILYGVSGDISEPPRDTSINNGGDFWMVKVDSVGNKQWDKRFGGNRSDVMYSVYPTRDGGYICGGYSASDSSGDKTQPRYGNIYTDFWVVKTDAQGNKQWDKRYGSTGSEIIYYIFQTSDGGYFLAGHTSSDSSGDISQKRRGSYDYWIVKTDSLGNKQWDKRYGGGLGAYNMLQTASPTADGGFILGGTTTADSSGDVSQRKKGATDYWIVKVDAQGNKQWEKRYGGNRSNMLYGLQQTSDGGYILGGLTNSDKSKDVSWVTKDTTTNPINGNDYWLVKTDEVGNIQWDKRFGGVAQELKFKDVIQTSDGGYLLSGTSMSNKGADKSEDNFGTQQMWLVKTDGIGNKQWDFTVFLETTNCIEGAGIIVPSSGNCYVIVNGTTAFIGGYKTQSSRGHEDYFIIKFCDTTTFTSLSEISGLQSVFRLLPNPASSEIFIESYGIEAEQINIYNTAGALVLQCKPTAAGSIDIRKLDSGVYMAEIQTKTASVIKRFVKM